MGHQRLGVLPQTRKWKAVIDLIAAGQEASRIAQVTARAVEHDLLEASKCLTLRYAFWLLTQIPLAARNGDFPGQLRKLGLGISDTPDLVEICSASIAAIDEKSRAARRVDDFSEIATLAAAESLHALASTESLFGHTYLADEAREKLRQLSIPREFGTLARDFFARVVRRGINYYLSRELPNHVGCGRRFPSLKDHHHFEVAIDMHCREAAYIVEDFAAEWFSKKNFNGGIDPEAAGGLVHVAIGKLLRELRIRNTMNA